MDNRPPSMYFLSRGLIEIWARIWLRFRAYGVANIPKTGGCILAANHASYLDPPIVSASFRSRVIHFMARDTLFKPGFPRWILTNVGCVQIDRTKGDVAALRRGLQVLKDGKVLGVFPEGTRSLDGQLQKAKGGIGFLIAKAKVPVVPIYVDGTFHAMSKRAKWVKPVKVRIFIGEPIMPDEVAAQGKGREAYESIAALVMSRIAALRPKP